MTKLNKNIIFFIVLFSIISILSIYCASIYTSKDLGNLALKQTLWYVIGIFILLVVVKVKNNFFYNNVWLLYGFGILMLALLLLFGTPINNSRCWFVIPGIGSVQPSEFMRLFIMLVLGKQILDFRKGSDIPTVKAELVFIIKSLFVVLIPSILTFLQPDTGAVIIYFVIYLFMIFVAGIRKRWFFIAISLACFILVICGSLYFFNESLFTDIFGTSIYYRIDRIFMWKDGVGLQLENAISAIGSAGFLGHGFNNTPIYFPEASTDFIFAVFASNFGFFGVIILLLILFFFDAYIIFLFNKSKSIFSKSIVAGILGMLLFQQVQNIGMTIGLLPITGITLPFISYGGSSLISYMIIMGILINISLERENSYQYK